MIGEAYNIIEKKVEEMDQKIYNQYQPQITEFYQKKYEKLYECLQPLKHDQQKQYLDCLKKYEKVDLNISHALENGKNQLYNCINLQYQITQKPPSYQPKNFSFNQQVQMCADEFEKDTIKVIENQLKTIKID
ncbi:hypothetical protein TTHERM_00411350 (macronuclear) [Tetrahymena thermophila SB210]|uniref:Uncharacterized protein n=1 Tax=Tetrahymena thermophila (strain SB210) TaxID=312017 RepID=I7MFT7_TETTS|nr:hypothetical protein TTHERM_00411350 [Tetrahymena thermophila SB210]EAS00584.1 hypothetical protein TTHERM_00411350 [Tetrahymena thermophila SB210]|eukprot:XP_001020829.1 hypothetical protein TTHERM_00411350 [Tetrahymena thermophila SB210]